MLAIEIALLTGRYSATQHNDRSRPEWPPHPQRFFSALVATWGDADEPDAAEREVLEALEVLGAPRIACSAAWPRKSVVAYVPVNDTRVSKDLAKDYEGRLALSAELVAARHAGDPRSEDRLEKRIVKLAAKVAAGSERESAPLAEPGDGPRKAAAELLPEGRGKQARVHPSVTPDQPTVQFVWPAAPEDLDRSVLDRLLARVHRLGHSSSFVSCRVVDEVDPSLSLLVPDAAGGEEDLRVAGVGLLAELERLHEARQAWVQRTRSEPDPYALPTRYATYGPPEDGDEVARPVLAGDWIVLEHFAGPQLPMTRTAEVASGVRAALMAHAADPPPELLSGHAAPSKAGASTPPSQRPHLAVLPIPFTGHPHADGAIHGVVLVVPESSQSDRPALDAALASWSGADGRLVLNMGKVGQVVFRHESASPAARVLREGYWCRPAATWATATPIALDRHPGSLLDRNPRRRARAEAAAARTIADACERLGLPRPTSVEVDGDPFLVGAPAAARFPVFQAGRGPRRALAHARLEFPKPVRGPVALGAGRYRGLGLCRPVDPPHVSLREVNP